MSTEYAALCSDFYINQKLALKMDLPFGREAVLDLFGRLRKQYPSLQHVRRFEGEVALESPEDDPQYQWLALTPTAVRSGWVNPETVEQAGSMHRTILETTPFFLSISPLDVEYQEMIFGFDLHAESNRNEIVFDALLGESALAGLVSGAQERMLDVQPFLGFSLDADEQQHAFVEVKTRPRPGELLRDRYDAMPISIYLTVRQYGPVERLERLPELATALERQARQLVDERLVPHVVIPIRQAISSPPPR